MTLVFSSMGEGGKMMQDSASQFKGFLMEEKGDDQRLDGWTIVTNTTTIASSTSSSSSSMGDSSSSNGSSDTTDDDASSSPNSSDGSLYDLSDLMTQLPIKRGLSKFYNGKSESFTDLSRVSSIDDLPKKEISWNSKRKLTSSKSYGGGLDAYKSHTLPKPNISKKTSRGSFCCTSSRRPSFSSVCKPPLIPAHNNL